MKYNCIFIFLIIACVLVYYHVLSFDFQWTWDDNWMIMNHFTSAGFSKTNISMIFTQYYNAQYSPLNEFVYVLIFKLCGYDPLFYHLFPLILHLINTCLVLLLIEQLIKKHTKESTVRIVAFVTALLFAVHPLQVESIAWISASKIPLYTCFVLLALLAYIRYVKRRRIGYYLLAILFFICAFGSKEQCVVLPATLLLIDWALERISLHTDKPQTVKAVCKKWVWLFFEKTPFLLIAAVGATLTYVNQGQDVIANWAGYPLGQRIVFCCYSIVEYLGKLIIPVNLLYLYPFPIRPGLPMPAKFFIYPIIVIGMFISLIYWLKKGVWRKHWPIIFGLSFFLINIGLMLHVIAMSRFTIIADRYVYLSSVGIFFIMAWYIVPWLQKRATSGRTWIFVFPIVYVFYLSGYAHYRTYVWKDSSVLKQELQNLINPELSNKFQQNKLQINFP